MWICRYLYRNSNLTRKRNQREGSDKIAGEHTHNRTPDLHKNIYRRYIKQSFIGNIANLNYIKFYKRNV